MGTRSEKWTIMKSCKAGYRHLASRPQKMFVTQKYARHEACVGISCVLLRDFTK